MAAGLGFKTFTTGEVLTAADTNGYLMQGVLVFASSAARAAAITSPQEGQYSYLKDTNSTEYYDGAAWIAAPIGDITGVTAGTGISGGGTSGTVTITNSMATEIAAKGDLIVGTGAATFDNLTVGANGTTLVADSTASTGLKWATPTSGSTFSGAACILSTSVSTANSTFTAINFVTEAFDTDSYHSNVTNPSRFTIPAGKTGYFLFTATATWVANATGYRQFAFVKNGSVTGTEPNPDLAANSVEQSLSASQVMYLVATDYVELQCWQNSGGSLNVRGTDSGNGRTFVSISYLGA